MLALAKNTKLLLVIVLVVLLIIFVYWMFFKNKTGSTGSPSGSTGSPSGNNQQNQLSGNQWKIGYIQIKDKANKQVWIHFADPRPAWQFVESGKKVTISNTNKFDGEYTIGDVWKDADGKTGAFVITANDINSFSDSQDYSLVNIGIITKL